MVQGVHLVGSVPLSNPEAVFRAVSGALGDGLATLPDGETGVRKDWIAWQAPVLETAPGLEPAPVGDRGYLRRRLVRRRGERGPIRIGPLGYADAALASFEVFDRLQRQGAIPAGVRFQVSLPTPLAPVTVFVDLPDRAAVEPPYEARMREELGLVCDRIPHERLAVQWDVAVEVGLVEGVWPAHFGDPERGAVERLARLGAAVPRDVALGYHLCYGDFGHRHFANPASAAVLVRLASALAGIGRPVAWIHMPVPVGWTEPAAYAPLRELALAPGTRLFLGLVHLADGVEGARRRIALASEFAPWFGVATECGWGRRPPETIPALLALHAELLAPARAR